jgi:hypothetical protein
MSQSEETNQGTPADMREETVRKPYVKPEFRHEKVFETMALSCGKVQTTQGSCHSNRKNS